MSHAPSDPEDDGSSDEGAEEPPMGDERDPASFRPGQREEHTATRRWAIRLLVGTAVGIPILVEGGTFLGLLDRHFGGGAADTESAPDTPAERRVDTGDELLPETSAREVLREATVQADGDRWTFEMAVDVENTTETPYEVRLGEVSTDAGTTVSGGASSGQVDPGGRGAVSATWTVPGGEEPTHVVVSGITHGESTDRVRESVRLASVTIEG